jgi:hypothetical protein
VQRVPGGQSFTLQAGALEVTQPVGIAKQAQTPPVSLQVRPSGHAPLHVGAAASVQPTSSGTQPQVVPPISLHTDPGGQSSVPQVGGNEAEQPSPSDTQLHSPPLSWHWLPGGHAPLHAGAALT